MQIFQTYQLPSTITIEYKCTNFKYVQCMKRGHTRSTFGIGVIKVKVIPQGSFPIKLSLSLRPETKHVYLCISYCIFYCIVTNVKACHAVCIVSVKIAFKKISSHFIIILNTCSVLRKNLFIIFLYLFHYIKSFQFYIERKCFFMPHK